jgi:Arc/MetJ family transcription regulator
VQRSFGDPECAINALRTASFDAEFVPKRSAAMLTAIALDEDLVAKAQKLTGVTERAALVRAALRALIAQESAKRLAALGGSDPHAKAPPRRRLPEE